MRRTTYTTQWGSDTITLSADWAQASCPVDGDEHGRQVADFRHSPAAAMRAALEDCARHEGTDPEDEDVAAAIDAAVEDMEEVRPSWLVTDNNARETLGDWDDVLARVADWYDYLRDEDEDDDLADVDLTVDTDGIEVGDLPALRRAIRETEARIAEAQGHKAFAGHGSYAVSAASEAGLALTVEEAD